MIKSVLFNRHPNSIIKENEDKEVKELENDKLRKG